jgi:hypothetical protein
MRKNTYADYLALAYLAAPEDSGGDESALEEMLKAACKRERRVVGAVIAKAIRGEK